jgi:hypothetical protein
MEPSKHKQCNSIVEHGDDIENNPEFSTKKKTKNCSAYTGDIVVCAFYPAQVIIDLLKPVEPANFADIEPCDDDEAKNSDKSYEEEPVWGNLPLSGKKYVDSRKRRAPSTNDEEET